MPARNPKTAKKGPKPVTIDRLVLEGESENAVLFIFKVVLLGLELHTKRSSKMN